ncbi:glutathione-disulfide reductase [Marinobacterium arenosum]|uniref:glutathione-disulfide reductase n=1 Tax=Marinobacterium arenosum TaxID=2862496 RepID=UPI001C94845A|nr:glutathione-disulfide reductase [Marinobacterium arenosum]MBY4676679.1 glutathione-disulfide reductase [Marinobacterium arenosum]
MRPFDYDLFVIGAGSGGVRASRMAAAMGVRVAVAEDRHIGGTCVNVGCVPKKLFVYASQFAEEFEQAAGYGWQLANAEFDWATLRDNKNAEIERLNGIYRNLLANSGCELIEGHATIKGPHTVSVAGRDYSTERILIATGGWPFVPDIPGHEHAISSNEVFYLEQFPKRAIVVGGGYIAVEFAGIFAGLGATTKLVYRGELFLRGFDAEVRRFAAEEIGKKGVSLAFNSDISAIEKLPDGTLKVTFNDGSSELTDCVLYATGRVPKVAGLGLENTRIRQQANGAILVDQQFQTDEPSIYAIGDVIDRMQLTPVALAEGMQLVKRLYGEAGPAVDYQLIPTAVFSQPNIATVGLTEVQARAQYGEVEVYKSNFRAMKQTLAGGQERTFMKLLVDKASDRVVGVHMVGPDAGEIIQGIAIALKAGATKQVFDATIGIHPTAAEEFVTMREPSN